MRKLGWIIAILGLISCSSTDDGGGTNNDNNNTARTDIPDPAFEQALIELGFDNVLDGSVATSSIENITDLVMNDKGISSLEGLSDFSSLVNLWVNDNMLSSINISQNSNLKFIFAERNSLSEINVVNLSSLEKLGLNGNQLTSIDVTNNFDLEQLVIPDNSIENIDVSSNFSLTILNVINNPLTCIRVNSEQFTNTPSGWQKDPEDEYAFTCN